MDTSKLSRGQLIAAIGGLVLVISLFLSWADVPLGGSVSAFDAFSGMDIILLLIGLVALAFAAATAMDAAASLPANAAWIVSLLGVLAIGWTLGWDLEESTAGFGAWIGLAAAIAIAYGAYESAAAPRPITSGPRRAAPRGRSRPRGPTGSSSPPTT